MSVGVSLHRFLMHYALVPAKLVYYGEVPGIAFTGILGTFFFSMFLHGGWLHIIGNRWYLWIFGDNVEDRLGHSRFLLFYIACGIVASMVHIFFNPRSTMPVVIRFRTADRPVIYRSGGYRDPAVAHCRYDPCPSDLQS